MRGAEDAKATQEENSRKGRRETFAFSDLPQPCAEPRFIQDNKNLLKVESAYVIPIDGNLILCSCKETDLINLSEFCNTVCNNGHRTATP